MEWRFKTKCILFSLVLRQTWHGSEHRTAAFLYDNAVDVHSVHRHHHHPPLHLRLLLQVVQTHARTQGHCQQSVHVRDVHSGSKVSASCPRWTRLDWHQT